jgi:Icc protein
MLIAQISDLHITPEGQPAYGVVDTAGLLAQCVGTLMRLDPLPDAVLASGDLVEGAQPREYARLKELLAPLTMPLYVMAGNHDERRALREAFDAPAFGYLRPAGEFLQYAVDLGELRLIVLDTVVPREGRGQLCATRLRWLQERLEEDQRPTLVAMHHPPFATGLEHMDVPAFEGAEAFERLIARHGHVERVLCGHLHRTIQCRFGGTVASICPSTAHQLALDLRAHAPGGFTMEPPGFQLHHWHAGRLVTHTCAVGDFPGPFPFG